MNYYVIPRHYHEAGQVSQITVKDGEATIHRGYLLLPNGTEYLPNEWFTDETEAKITALQRAIIQNQRRNTELIGEIVSLLRKVTTNSETPNSKEFKAIWKK